jgi:2-oxoglutarate ferredoxin oxidoreductase subunit gamma
MQTEIIIAGFGGQGALFAGQLLAYAAMDEGHAVTWIPSYGPEMRGGTAHCTVVIADEEIGSPLVRNPVAVIAMNQPSLEKFAPSVAAGGVLVVNEVGVVKPPDLPGRRVIVVPATAEAERLGAPQTANVLLLGALLTALPVLPLAAIEKALAAHLPEHRRDKLEANRRALQRGAALAGLAPIGEAG